MHCQYLLVLALQFLVVMSATSVNPVPPSSQAECQLLIDETFCLIRQTSTRTFKSDERLKLLLCSCFQDDVQGRNFRSLACTGRLETPVSIDQFNQFVVWPSTNFEFHLVESSPILFQLHAYSPPTRADLQSDSQRPAHAKVDFALHQAVLYHPLRVQIQRFMSKPPPHSWKQAVLGIKPRSALESIDIPSFEELHSRIAKSIEFALCLKHTNIHSKFFSATSGAAWSLKVEPPIKEYINYEALYLQASSKFSEHLGGLLKDSGLYLDELAGVVDYESYPDVEARIERLMKMSTLGPRVVGVDLFKSKEKVELGGSVCAIHEYLSPRFLAFYTVDHDASCAYMKDIRAAHKKDRKIRFSSTKHVEDKPLWVQFGEDSQRYLYLSRKASVGEEAWLKIVNYVMDLLVKYVNAHIKKVHGENISKAKLLRLKIFTELVNGIAKPIDGNYGAHGDDRNGTVSKTDPQFSRFMLTVPALCLQNYAQETTSIAWRPRDGDITWDAGVVWQFFCLIHIQLYGVQEYFKHYVCYLLLFVVRCDHCFITPFCLSFFTTDYHQQ